MGFSLDGCRGKAQVTQVHPPCPRWMSTSLGTRQTMFRTFPRRVCSAHNLQMSRLPVASTPWYNRCRETGAGFTSNASNVHIWHFWSSYWHVCICTVWRFLSLRKNRKSSEKDVRCSAQSWKRQHLASDILKSLKDVLEETVLRWKSFGIPECDVEVHATDSGQFLPPTDLPMTPRDSNNLKAKDVRADGPSDAESQEQCPNLYAAAWKTAEEERPEPLIWTTASSRRFAGDVESLNKASPTASGHGYTVRSARCRFRTRGEKIKSVPSIDRTARCQCWEWIRIPANRVVPLILDFLPVDEVAMFDVRAVSRFFASPKAWVFHLFKLVDIDSLPTSSPEKQMHPVVEYFHKGSQPEIRELENVQTQSRLLRSTCREHQNVAEVLFSGCTTFTGGSCINLTWYTILLMFVLKALTTNLVNHQQEFSGRRQSFCIKIIRGLNCDCASPVAWWTMRALPRSNKLFARYWKGLASLCLSVDALTGISWQSSSGLWLLMKHCSALLRQSIRHGRPSPGRWSCASCCFQETFGPCLHQTGNALRSQAWTAWVAGGMIRSALFNLAMLARREASHSTMMGDVDAWFVSPMCETLKDAVRSS